MIVLVSHLHLSLFCFVYDYLVVSHELVLLFGVPVHTEGGKKKTSSARWGSKQNPNFVSYQLQYGRSGQRVEEYDGAKNLICCVERARSPLYN